MQSRDRIIGHHSSAAIPRQHIVGIHIVDIRKGQANMRRAGFRLMLILLLGITLLQTMGSVGAVNDTTPPVVQSASLSATTVAAGGSLTLTLHITDDLSGLAAQPGVSIQFNLSGGTQSIYVYNFIRASGTPQDGMYQAIVNVPAAYPSGTYTVSDISAVDQASNQANYYSCCVPQIPAADNVSFTVYDPTIPSPAPSGRSAPPPSGLPTPPPNPLGRSQPGTTGTAPAPMPPHR
jgi:hypothetical protein